MPNTSLDQAARRQLQGIEHCLEFVSAALKRAGTKGHLDAGDALGAARILADCANELDKMIGDEPPEVQ
jgi:hypothetical protein